MYKFLIACLLMSLIWACETPGAKELPILGNKTEQEGETIYHTIPDFSFVNQDSAVVNNATFNDKAYVVDFFFVSCPTICPKVKKQMLRIYEKFDADDNLALLSHTIDTKRDTVGRLKKYAENLGVSSDRWHFVTGNKDEIYEIADDYFSIVIEDENAPGGFDHSGRLILVDKNKHIRSYCDGTDAKDVDRFMKDIQTLLAEDETSAD
jgi:protein SCO1/2